MSAKFRFLLRILFIAAAVMYPILVFYFLAIKKTPIQALSIFVIAFALLAFIIGTAKKKAIPHLLFGLPFFF
ncbi:MAG: hypothetical protein FWH35_03410 [Treponema sp.]|nr:hypothetical protein [Treponema sp.]